VQAVTAVLTRLEFGGGCGCGRVGRSGRVLVKAVFVQAETVFLNNMRFSESKNISKKWCGRYLTFFNDLKFFRCLLWEFL
jgi:hypothetical protein